MSFPSVSVVIPVKNEAFKIRACIGGILKQTVPVKEIIVIDSGSTDGTLAILKEYPIIKLIEIDPQDFNHGETRNMGVRNASSEFVLLTVGDARPCNEYWIEEMLNGFIDDEVSAVCGQQVVPHEKDKNPADWFRPVSEPEIRRYQYKHPSAFEALTPAQKKEACGWDDVNALYRRSVLMEIPFQQTPYCEDAIWARDALLRGHAIVYNFKARVYHYHHENSDFVLKRSFTTMYFRYRLFGYLYERPAFTLHNRLSLIKILLRSCGASISDIIKWYKYNKKNFHAVLEAYILFNKTLAQGEKALDDLHMKLCGQPPVPLKAQ
jgi:rhamnosyltransferase